jgi:hypothetical protein
METKGRHDPLDRAIGRVAEGQYGVVPRAQLSMLAVGSGADGIEGVVLTHSDADHAEAAEEFGVPAVLPPAISPRRSATYCCEHCTHRYVPRASSRKSVGPWRGHSRVISRGAVAGSTPDRRASGRAIAHRRGQYRTVAIERSRARPISRRVAPLRASSSTCFRSGARRGANLDTAGCSRSSCDETAPERKRDANFAF